ncbi:hypothetical protein BC936DRAFT_149435 [Jimgerdemannia flammicorona]|uniref:HSF-type DNA-binding domain-containing protein n=1 Tax=Jimgerdemannia flammicorona TaxID=994334 RepID=A0A433DK70_9FUNG|nr:hypothetical protein BC936DRAFT_149435 [Jimgerdemannia flammicorona]
MDFNSLPDDMVAAYQALNLPNTPDGSVSPRSPGSHCSSPLASPLASPRLDPLDDYSPTSQQFLPRPAVQPVKMSNNTFVHKLYKYGFHKVNKSPRGHRTLAENQIWEFSHPKFLRGRPDLLDDIKRKAMESETLRRETGDLHAHLAMMQVAQSDMMQQIAHLQENFSEVVRELAETKRKQGVQQQMMKNMMDFMSSQQGAQLTIPPELNFDNYDIKPEPDRPPIYITSPDSTTTNMLSSLYFNGGNSSSHQLPQRPNTPLTVQTQNLPSGSLLRHSQMNIAVPSNYLTGQPVGNQPPLSPNSLNAYNTAVNTPLPPSPSPSSPLGTIVSDDDMNDSGSMYSPNTPTNSYGSDHGEDGRSFTTYVPGEPSGGPGEM